MDWHYNFSHAIEDIRNPSDEPGARSIAVLKLIGLLLLIAAIIAGGVLGAKLYWASSGH